MAADSDARIIDLGDGACPRIHDSAWVAPGAVVVGRVILEAGSSIWYNATLRAEREDIRIGAGSNVQDGVAMHVDSGFPLSMGRNVSVGHNAVVHGATVEDGALIGMNATVLNGAVIGAGSLIAAGALVLAGTVVPPGSLVAGVPGKVRRELTAEEREGLRENAAGYLVHTEEHRNRPVAPSAAGSGLE
ncbi:gamma carbonic anhydrase family protein [Klugiella xanthotipulae]|uniref:Carbonic anhydrase/acetyltransferase-like protein (Isoleucine patch superfamily) n=1 Tax=Klugiella xanthotipulae TaxID=244735 RepID=A0A543HSH7_9MICO|nr:gamma carbonic anhydrase family protein [Klugiella xanthotipulae]TQM61293.1 carbonic anhydrase/acetyltransferase-like protein (isoleucine patch superfamily) [Klugiella xanthotipulae]